MRGDGFVLREFQGIRYYSCCAFERLPRICHGFSTRKIGLAVGAEYSLDLGNSSWNTPERVSKNRRCFLSALHLEDAHLITLRQVHSNCVYIIEDISGRWNQSEGDALATRVENVALAVNVADCIPILIADPVNNAVAAVHSGWRGTLSRVLLQTIREMQQAFNSNPATLLVAVGPGIRACCFEVGMEVAGLFGEKYPGCNLAKPINARPGKYLLDLCGALYVQLDLAGVPPENRYDLGACTCCNTGEFFSYRAEGTVSGRMMAVIGLSRE
jgi:YfiH family protein